MSSPFNFNLDQRTSLWIVVISIFLISLSVGMLILGDPLPGNLSTDTLDLNHSSAVLPFFK